MSNKLYKPPVKQKDTSLRLFIIWLCLMGAIFASFFIPAIRSVPLSGVDTDMATPSNATYADDSYAIGFLTLDGKGIAEHPFMTESEMNVVWGDTVPDSFTALPLLMSGSLSEEDGCFYVQDWGLYPYTRGTTGAADAYFTCIESGWQEGFEDLWAEVYDVLNTDEEPHEINAVILQEILEGVYGNEEFGDLRDVVTDCLVLVNDINLNGKSDEYNEQALAYYNRFYSWLCSFSVDMLKTE